MIAPIYVISRGRSDACVTAKNLDAEGLRYTLVVEPREEVAYREAHPNARILLRESDDVTAAQARNWLIADHRLNDAWKGEWLWMLDDDISDLRKVREGKTVKAPWAEVLSLAQKCLTQIQDLAIGGLEYNQFAWSARKKLAMDGYCDVCVLVNTTRTRPFRYRIEGREDRDFVLQCLDAGLRTARSSFTAFACPAPGANKGGHYDAHKAGKDAAWIATMCRAWPSYCREVTKKNGRLDVKCDFRAAAKAGRARRAAS